MLSPGTTPTLSAKRRMSVARSMLCTVAGDLVYWFRSCHRLDLYESSAKRLYTIAPRQTQHCAMLSYTAYDRSSSLSNSKAKLSQGHSLQAITLGLYESKLLVHFEAYLTNINLSRMFFPLLDTNEYAHPQIFRTGKCRKISIFGPKAVLLRR